MLTVEDYARIRIAHRDGMSVRALARTYHHSRRKVREVLAQPEPRPYTRTQDPPRPKLAAFTARIDQILSDDAQAPPKQRHTAMQVFRRLRDEHGYSGGYDVVRRYIGRTQRHQRETFIPLTHDPGQRLECDFGHIYVDFPDGRRQVPVFMAVWSYSYCPFAIALPTERTEAILAGLVAAFAFFNCVPREVWWDNPKTVATAIYVGRRRTLNPRYAALASHYAFEPLFCMPARGNEKPHVENRVFDLQRRWATPVPQATDREALNAWLRQCALQDRQRCVAGQTQTVGRRFEQDRAAAGTLAPHAFEACVHQPGGVDKFQTVRFDAVRYSVPRDCAFTTVTVKAYIDRVEIVGDAGRIVAQHRRSYERGAQVLDPLHYLPALQRRPGALDHANVYRHWDLPVEFSQLRRQLEQRHGPAGGVRHYARVLQLLADHPLARVRQAIAPPAAGRAPHDLDAERLAREVQRLAYAQACRVTAPAVPGDGGAAGPPDALPPWCSAEALIPASLCQVQVPPPDLRCFDQLLSEGEPVHA